MFSSSHPQHYAKDVKKILVIKPSGIGDIVHAIPVARAMKIIYPGAVIHWVVFTKFAGLFKNVDCVDEVIGWDRRGGLREFYRIVSELRREKYDIAIDLQGLLRTAFLNRFSGAGVRFATPLLREGANLIEKPVERFNPGLHAVERNYRVAEFIAGRQKKNIPPPSEFVPWLVPFERGVSKASNILEGLPRPIVVFATASRGAHKIWPGNNFAALINLMYKKWKITPVLVGTEREREITSAVLSGVVCRPYLNLAGEISLAELPAVISQSDLVIGNDSGVIHIAAALGLPTLGIFGATNPRWYYPYNKKSRYIYKNYPCSPCDIKTFCRDYKCMKDITPEEVISVVGEMI